MIVVGEDNCGSAQEIGDLKLTIHIYTLCGTKVGTTVNQRPLVVRQKVRALVSVVPVAERS